MSDLTTYLRSHPPKGFKPVPRLNPDGQLIEWWWEDVSAVSESIHHDGKWVGTVHKAADGRVVGISVHMEAVAGLKYMGLGCWVGPKPARKTT